MTPEPKAIVKSENETVPVPASEPPASRWLYNPDADIVERGDEYIVTLDLPGVAHDQIDLTVENWTLTVRGRVPQRYPRSPHVIRCEYGIGDYYRQFRLGESLDPDRITAEWCDGTLTVHLPKVQAAQNKKIVIQKQKSA